MKCNATLVAHCNSAVLMAVFQEDMKTKRATVDIRHDDTSVTFTVNSEDSVALRGMLYTITKALTMYEDEERNTAKD